MLTQLPPGAAIVICGPSRRSRPCRRRGARPATPIAPGQFAGLLDRRGRAVAGRGDDDRAGGVGLADRVDVALRAGGVAAEAHVDDARRRRVVRDVRTRGSRPPTGCRPDVGVVAAALAEHAHRHDAHGPADARHADAVVGRRADQPERLRAVPRAVASASQPSAPASAAVTKSPGSEASASRPSPSLALVKRRPSRRSTMS